MPCMCIRFFGHNSAICRPIGLKFFMVTQETIIYQLVFFWGFHGKKSYFGGKMGVAATVVPQGLGPQDPT